MLVGSVKPLKSNQLKYSLIAMGIIDDLVFANIDQHNYHHMVINAGRIKQDLAHIDEQLSIAQSKEKMYDMIC